jgi:hypothetical protein
VMIWGALRYNFKGLFHVVHVATVD